ncbi:hypothetical protein ACOMHN_034765 [Nucella lapillus]
MADTQYCCCCCCFLRQLLVVFLLFPTLTDAAENCRFTSGVNVTSKEIVLTCQCPEGRLDSNGFPMSRGEPPAMLKIRIQTSGPGIGFRLTSVNNLSPNKWTRQNTFKYSYNQSSIPVVNTGHLRFACHTQGFRYSHEIVNTVYKLTVNLLDYYTSAPTTTTTTTTVPPITTTVTTSTKTQRPTATTTTTAANKTTATTTTTTAADKTTATNKKTATFADFKLGAADAFAPKIVEAVTAVKYKPSNTLMGGENADAEIEMLRIPLKMLITVGVCAVFLLVIGLIIFILAKRRKRRRRKRKSRNLSMTEMGLPPTSPPPVCSRNADGKEQLPRVIDRLLTQFPSSHQQGYKLTISQENIYDEVRSEDGSSSAVSTYAECDLPTAFQQTYRDDGEPTERLHEFSHQTDGHSHPQADFTEENDGYLVPQADFTEEDDGYLVRQADFTEGDDGYLVSQADFTEENDGYLVPQADFTEEDDGYLVRQADFTEGDDGYLVPQADFTEENDGYLVPQAPRFSEATRQQVRDNHLEKEAHQVPLYDDAEEASHYTKLTSHCAEVASHYDELRKVSHRDNAEDAYSLYSDVEVGIIR